MIHKDDDEEEKEKEEEEEEEEAIKHNFLCLPSTPEKKRARTDS